MSYTKINFEDYPSKATPLNADNLNKMDSQIHANAETIEKNAEDIAANTAALAEKVPKTRTIAGLSLEQDRSALSIANKLASKIIVVGNSDKSETETLNEFTYPEGCLYVNTTNKKWWLNTGFSSSGGNPPYIYTWKEMTADAPDLSGYVPTSRTIADLDLTSNITKDSFRSALGNYIIYLGTTDKEETETVSVSAGYPYVQGGVYMNVTNGKMWVCEGIVSGSYPLAVYGWDLLNESGFLTEHQSLENYALATSVPTKTSDLENDSGFLTTVSTNNLANMAVTNAKLATFAVSNSNIIDGTITASKLASGVVPTKISDLTNDSAFPEMVIQTGKTVPVYDPGSMYNVRKILAIPNGKYQGYDFYLLAQKASNYNMTWEKIAYSSDIPTKTSDLTNDSGFVDDVSDKMDLAPTITNTGQRVNLPAGQIYTEDGKHYIKTGEQKVSDTADRLALYDDIPTKTSDLTNDSGFLTQHQSLAGKADKSEIVINNVKTFGAVGDGTTDDTSAIQSALNAGGVVYFPAGTYKVTSQLNAYSKPCEIRMERPYPQVQWKSTGTDTYDLDDGALIETYVSSGYGLLLGASTSVDGLYMRAMNSSFNGTLLKYDGKLGTLCYPSSDRLRHIILDSKDSTVIPESLFDFYPYMTYGILVEDVVLGSATGRQFCDYGFRVLFYNETDENSNKTNWANSIHISDMKIDTHATYPFYFDSSNALQAKDWTFSNIKIQAYPFQSGGSYYLAGRTGHQNVVYLKGISAPYFSGCKIWDVDAADVLDDVIKTVSVSDITAFGNDTLFNAIDTVLTAKLNKANEINLARLTTSVATDAETGSHTVSLTDGNGLSRNFTIPAASITEEQVGNAVSAWMEDNAEPVETVGKNKLNPDGCVVGKIESNGNIASGWTNYWSTEEYIPCSQGDEIRFYDHNNTFRQAYNIAFYDSTKTLTKWYDKGGSGGADVTPMTVTAPNDGYFRISQVGSIDSYAQRSLCMLTQNTTDTTYEAYTVTLEGGIGQYLILMSPNGTYYTLSVDDSGNLSATAV